MIAIRQHEPAIETAARIYAAHGSVLARDLENYLRHPFAHIIKRPDFLLLARPVVKDDVERWLEEPGEADAWYVKLLVGSIGAALREMPHVLPFCCWHRNFRTPGGRLHVVATDKIHKKTKPYHGR